MNLINNNMEQFCMYLRKSRKDLEAEAYGQGETLSRHQKRLEDYAASVGIEIKRIYKEIVSGETISARPVMQELLADVEAGMWAGVLVVEVERLARGNTLDQGIVSNAFQYSGTKIITPLKTYDPNNDDDEEYFEFGLFMSRREYKKINQRLHNGILASINEGKFVSGEAPYGYEKYKLSKQKGYSLKINKDEAEMIKIIFNSYANLEGLVSISRKLHSLGYKPKNGETFAKSTLATILTNPVYIGKIRYNDKETTKKVVNGNIIRVKNPNNNLITVDGMHEPIISLDLWNKVQSVRKSNLINKERVDYSLKNPMSNIVKCGICGRAMQRITYVGRNDVRLCCRRCKENVGSNIDFVEDKLLQSLKSLLKEYKIKLLKNDNSDNDLLLKANEQSINKNLSELEKANLQLNNLYDLLEQGIYTKELFLQRMQLAKDKISTLQDAINKLNEEKEKILNAKNNKEIIIPKIENVIDTYYETDDIELKNKLLKSVLYKVDYLKVNPKDKDDFKLILYPKLY